MTMPISYDAGLALTLDLGRERAMAAEAVALAAAGGRIAAFALDAPFALPGFANAAMDGYAIAAGDLPASGERRFPLAGTVLAGAIAPPALAAGQAMAIMTGAPLPSGSDTVVMREQARQDGADVWLPAGPLPGAHVRAADDDCARGVRLFDRGDVLTPARVAVLAALGQDRVAVARRPRVAILVTGDELVAGTGAAGPGLRHDSNGPMLGGLVAAAGGELVAQRRCRDDPVALRGQLLDLSAQADLVLSTGGVSAGAADHLPSVLDAIARVVFWKLRMKPGMPVLLARRDDSILFALPGNPVSAGVCFQVLVAPLLAQMLGRRQAQAVRATARLATPWRKTHARLEFLRVQLAFDDDGRLQATPVAHQGSGALSMLAAATGLARLEEGERDYPIAAQVEVQGSAPPWSS